MSEVLPQVEFESYCVHPFRWQWEVVGEQQVPYEQRHYRACPSKWEAEPAVLQVVEAAYQLQIRQAEMPRNSGSVDEPPALAVGAEGDLPFSA